MIVVLIAGLAVLLAGLAAIGLGIPVKEFSFGNTLILAGAFAVCTGLILIALSIAIRELKGISRRLHSAERMVAAKADAEPYAPPVPGADLAAQRAGGEGLSFGRDQRARDPGGGASPPVLPGSSAPPPWPEPALRDSGRSRDETAAASVAPPVVAPEPPAADSAATAKPRRNLLFASLSRKERERPTTQTVDQPATEPGPAPPGPPPPDVEGRPRATFEDAWPQSERARPDGALRRSGRAPSTFSEPGTAAASADRAPPPLPRAEDPPQVTVLKSGVVDGMAYSLYSDGSIETQMPEGMMRFGSIDELRAHLDQRPQ